MRPLFPMDLVAQGACGRSTALDKPISLVALLLPVVLTSTTTRDRGRRAFNSRGGGGGLGKGLN